jgi:molybdenum ABC transporter molybdate-binding protein
VKTSGVIFFTLMVLVHFSGCIYNTSKDETREADIIVYCENGILEPVKEIISLYEKSTGLKVDIHNDCARNLTSLIHYRREADIFIPDSRLSIDLIKTANPELIADSAFLGIQTLVFMVAKGNPKRFDGQLNALLNKQFGVILANPETSTLGNASELLLQHHALYNEVKNSVLFLTIDSRGLIRNISSGQASLAISWRSDYFSNHNALSIDTISIASPHKHYTAMAVLLKNAHNKSNAKKQLQFLESGKSKQIFEKYGIPNYQNTNF